MVTVRWLPGALLFLAHFPAQAFIAAQEVPGSDMSTIVWVLAGVFVFFAIVIVFTWALVKSERKQGPESRDSKPIE